MEKSFLPLLLCAQLAFSTQPPAAAEYQPALANFPAINQREIKGAEFRCGTVALGSWIQWLTDEGRIASPRIAKPDSQTPFTHADLPEETRTILARLDVLAGGRGEIKLYDLVGALVQYMHELPDHSQFLTIHYYNLPNETFLRQLQRQNLPIVLFHGIHRKDPDTGRIKRVDGHYTCLVGQTERYLTANTYARNYQFNLSDLPMSQLSEKDRYKAAGFDSLIYMRYPEKDFPRYRFKSFAPGKKDQALLQTNVGGQVFAEANEVIFLEGALVFQVSSD
jgi:hypothetical protein